MSNLIFLYFLKLFLLMLMSVCCNSSNCYFKVPSKSVTYNYDLSRLEQFPYKAINIVYKNEYYVMYLSLCQQIEDIPISFLDNRRVKNLRLLLVKKKDWSVEPVFSSSINFKELSVKDNDLNVSISTEVSCEKFFNLHFNYSIKIMFKCSIEEYEPSFKQFNENTCEFIIKWLTPSACPVNSFNSNCSIEIRNKKFDLSSFRHPFYYLSEIKGIRIKMNFCELEGANNGDSSEFFVISGYVEKNNLTQVVFTKNNTKVDFDDENVSLIFDYSAPSNENVLSHVSLKVVCKPEAFTVKPQLILKERHKKLQIVMESYFNCIADRSCFGLDDNFKYNLPKSGNVIVHNGNTSFVLNSCGNLERDSFWLGGRSLAAFVNGSTVMSLGFLRSLHINNKEQTVEMITTGGSVCPESGKRAKAVVTFKCSERAKNPIFINSNNCEFKFEWSDPSSCPIPATSGSGCVIRDPQFGFTFNLNESSAENIRISDSKDTFEINLCGRTKNVCNLNRDVSICLFKEKKEIIVGKQSTQKFFFENGQIFFHLFGEDCLPNVPYQVFVNLTCDYGSSNGSLQFLTNYDSSCTFYFKWNTKLACPEEKTVPCTAKNVKGQMVDLTPLQRLSSNFKVEKDKNSYFLINVCHSLWYGHDEVCPKDSGACLKDKKEIGSVGFIGDPPFINENDEVVLMYKNYGLCSSENSSDLSKNTMLTFRCSSEEKGPVYTGTTHCTHNFVWNTAHACLSKAENTDGQSESNYSNVVTRKTTSFPEFITEKETTTTSNVYKPTETTEDDKFKNISCIINNSTNKIDLSVLGSKKITLNENLTLYFNICQRGAISYGTCSDAFSCLVTKTNKTLSLGSLHDPPVLTTNNTVVLNYYNGSLCEENPTTTYSLSLLLSCSKVEKTKISRFPCKYEVFWETRKVCPKESLFFNGLNCTLTNKKTNESIDVSFSFIQKEIKVESKKKNFLVNLCSPNVRKNRCNGDVCLKKDNMWISFGNLDFADYNYNINETEINFNNGDLCGEKGSRYSSRILLKCAQNFMDKSGYWVLSNDSCSYTLELESPNACMHYIGPAAMPSKSSATTIIVTLVLVLLIVGAFFVIFRYRSKLNGNSCWKRKLSSYSTISLLEKLKFLALFKSGRGIVGVSSCMGMKEGK